MPSISHMLWFDSQAEEAANFYVNIFPDGKVTNVAKGPDGKAFTVNFSILGKDYIGLNGRSFLSNRRMPWKSGSREIGLCDAGHDENVQDRGCGLK